MSALTAATSSAVRVRAIGHIAHGALLASGGVATPIPSFEQSPYLIAAGEIIWLGRMEYQMHPRAVFVDAGEDTRRGARQFDTGAQSLSPWRPRSAARHPGAVQAIKRGANSLRERIAGLRERSTQLCERSAEPRERSAEPRKHAAESYERGAELGEPRGLGLAMVGIAPPFPLDLGMTRLHALVRAVSADDAEASYRAAVPLLGFGPGLTPSGDDFVGALLFGRQLVSPRPAWTDVARRLAGDARGRSHVIGAALFGDLARGESFASLHELAGFLATGDCDAAAIDAARSLVKLGHSSGWDMLAGFLTGLTGMLQPAKHSEGMAPALAQH
ncbi:MAG: DUF2877 domain-containing protein [Betaproteobacteria bacterium]|nr:DUF2877 domain-containing protein [Betaproteobacteria bacterium]